jgi:hypothetical protein
MEKKSIISTLPPLHFPKITFTFCASIQKPKKILAYLHSLFDALRSSLTDPLEGLTMWKCRRS